MVGILVHENNPFITIWVLATTLFARSDFARSELHNLGH